MGAWSRLSCDGRCVTRFGCWMYCELKETWSDLHMFVFLILSAETFLHLVSLPLILSYLMFFPRPVSDLISFQNIIWCHLVWKKLLFSSPSSQKDCLTYFVLDYLTFSFPLLRMQVASKEGLRWFKIGLIAVSVYESSADVRVFYYTPMVISAPPRAGTTSILACPTIVVCKATYVQKSCERCLQGRDKARHDNVDTCHGDVSLHYLHLFAGILWYWKILADIADCAKV